MPTLNQRQRQFLRKLAHDLRPVVQIGKNGLTDQTVASADDVLRTQELIKVKFFEFQDEKNELSEQLAGRTGSELVAVIGNIAILYRENPDLRKIKLPL